MGACTRQFERAYTIPACTEYQLAGRLVGSAGRGVRRLAMNLVLLPTVESGISKTLAVHRNHCFRGYGVESDPDIDVCAQGTVRTSHAGGGTKRQAAYCGYFVRFPVHGCGWWVCLPTHGGPTPCLPKGALSLMYSPYPGARHLKVLELTSSRLWASTAVLERS